MNKYLINVKGKNIRNFLIKVAKKNINLLNISFINDNEINILIDKKDFDLLNDIKGIYEYKVIKEYGTLIIKNILIKNIHLIIIIILNVFLIFHISNYIYEVEIVENSKDLKAFINTILIENGIQKHHKKPSDLNKLKEKIIKENHDKIEWLEIIESGVKYIVKAEERIKNKSTILGGPSNIIASKDGIIKKIVASSGKVLAEKNAFVKKGDILITGIISDEKMVKSSGNVYANVWYKIKSEASLHESSYELTNNTKKGLKINFFNKEFKLYKKYKTNEIKENVIFKNDLLPFYLSIDEINETKVIDNILTFEEAKNKAIKKAKENIRNNLKEDEKIISENELKVTEKDSKIIVEILFTVYENISKEERIEVLNVQGDY